MSSKSDNQKEDMTVYGSIGFAIFFICVGIVYLIPDTFPEGTLYIVAGLLIIMVNILNSFRGITYSGSSLLFAAAAILMGSNKILELELGFWPVLLIVVGLVSLLANINKLR